MIDRETQPKHIWISFNESVLEDLRENAKKEFSGEVGEEEYLITTDMFKWENEETYIDKEYEGKSLQYKTSLNGMKNGENKVYISFTMPFSQKQMLPVLNHAQKVYNKIKSAMESVM